MTDTTASTTAAPFSPEQAAMLERMAARARQEFSPEQVELLNRLAEQARAQPDPFAEAAGEAPPAGQSTAPEGRPGMVRRVLGDIGAGIIEAPTQILRGGAEALDAAADGLRSVFVSREQRAADPTPRVADNFAEATTVTGALVNDVSQFAAGFIGANRILRGFGALQGAGAVVTAGRGAAAGAAADFTVFRAHEDRLSNLIEQYPQLSNPVTRYLAADPSDSELEGRLKNAIEGLGLGVATEGLLAGLRAIRGVRRGDHAAAREAAEEAANVATPPRDPLVDPDVARQMDEEAEAELRAITPEESARAEQAELGLEGGETRGQTHPDSIRANPGADPHGPTTEAPAAQPDTYAPRVLVDNDALRDIVTQYQREAGFGQDRNLSGIRTDLIEGNQDVNQTLSAIRVAVREQMDAADPAGAVGTVRPLEAVRRNAEALAHDIGGDPDLFFQRLAGQADNTRHLDAEVTTYRIFLTSIHDRVSRYARALNDATGNDLAGFGSRAELGEQFRKHVELLANVSALYRGVQTNIARSLNAMRLPVRPSADMMRELHNIDALAARFAMADDVAQTVRLANGGWFRNATGAVNEYWINSILSGPKTQAVNVLSNMATAALQPAERMIAGAIHGNRDEFLQGGLQYVGMAQSLREAMTLAARAFREGDATIDPFRSTVEMQGRHAISAQRFGLDGADGMATIVDWLGTVVRLPSRLLTTQDEFFKQLTYRARIRAGAWREAASSGLQWGSRDFADFVQRRLDGAFHPDGRAVHEEALAAARNATFTDDLAAQTWSGGRTLGESLQGLTGNHPFLQLVMPFVRTPTNIARFIWNRTPVLNVARAQYANDLVGRNGTEAAMRARAQMVTGGVLWGTALTFALDGTITGGGPNDPAIQRQLRATGWQPYSIRFQNPDGTVTYRAFDRADPFATFFATAADFAEAAAFMGDREVDQLATDMMVTLARQLQNKTYLSGLTRAIAALAEPDRRGERFLFGLAGSFVPSFVNQTIRDDPHMREVRSILDAIRARTPGSVGMDPVRNVLGEAIATPAGYGPDWISPIAESSRPGGAQPVTPEWRHTVRDGVHDEIARQMVLHNSGLRPPAPKFYGTVDLREWQHPDTGRTAYDRFQTLVGEVDIGGVTLREALSDLIHSPEYREDATDGSFDHDGSRMDLIRRLVGYYRQAAEMQLREEMPALDDALTAAQTRQALIRVR